MPYIFKYHYCVSWNGTIFQAVVEFFQCVDKILARERSKQAISTEDFDFHMSDL
jgi:uncharacterized Rmd1/YagE family protein